MCKLPRFICVILMGIFILNIHMNINASTEKENVISYLIEENKRLKTENNALKGVHPNSRTSHHYYHKPRVGFFGWARRGVKMTVLGGLVYAAYSSNLFDVQNRIKKFIDNDLKKFEKDKKEMLVVYASVIIKTLQDMLSEQKSAVENAEKKATEKLASEENKNNTEKN